MRKALLVCLVCTVVTISSVSALAETLVNNPPNMPSDPHPSDEASDIGIKTHVSWTGGDPDP
ncbi:MAG: hypothetical protein ACP5FL_09780, partial [Thermoplasmatota archaeon]